MAIGGVMYLVMSRSTSGGGDVARVQHPQPGWIARKRARRGVRHPHGGASLGYRSALQRVALSKQEFSLGGLVLGAPGSGKTNMARLLVQALAANGTAGVILDPKPSRALAETVAAAGGIIWTLGGELAWDALPDDPTELANQLVEVEPVDGQMRVYRNAARLQALAIGQVLKRKGEHPTLERVAALMQPGALKAHPEAPKLSQTEWEGVRSFGTSLQILARGAAGRSLGVGGDGVLVTNTLRLEDAIADGKVVLFQLDSSRLPEETRQVGAWVLRSMLRLLRQPQPCWLIADEFARLGWQGRHALELLALGREFGKPVTLLSQGPSDFRELGTHALDMVAQDAAWILAFRQGTRDSDTAARLLGVHEVSERSWTRGPGRDSEHVRLVEKPIVMASVLEDLPPGSAFVRVPPVDRGRVRVEPVRVALPSDLSRRHDNLPAPGTLQRAANGSANSNLPPIKDLSRAANSLATGDSYGPDAAGDRVTEGEGESAAQGHSSEDPPDKRIARYSERQGVHWVWHGGMNSDGYPRLKVKGKLEYVHLMWWEHVNGPVPEGMTLHHTCDELYGKLCVWPGCMEVVTRERNTELRHERDRGEA